jgi:membrane protein
MISLKTTATLVWRAFELLKKNDPLIFASSTAFFTTFALSPIIIILLGVFSLYFNNDEISEELFQSITNTFGKETASEIESIVNNMGALEGDWLVTIAGFIFLIFVATTLMMVIKRAINTIWRIRPQRSAFWKYTILERAKAGIIILLMGALFIASQIIDASVSLMHDSVEHLVPSFHMEVLHGINIVFSFVTVTAWFMLLYKILPDSDVRWSVAFAGGVMTAALFSLGKWILGRLLLFSVAVNIFGASASFALVLLFIFYSSLTLYFGAAFTYLFAEEIGKPITPGRYGRKFEVSFIDKTDA